VKTRKRRNTGQDRLTTYKSKRDFRKSPEPHATGTSKWKKDRNRIFVIQEHDASHLHYDFRIEMEGVLKSWAVPKGPSTNPADKRLAVATEDHPLSYADFEGVIPEHEYGAGTVIVWDAGPYRNISRDPHGKPLAIQKAYARGLVEIWLEGKKIRGGYALVNSKLRGDERNWLLVKMRDEAADARRNPVSTEPKSVMSGLTIRQVRAAAKRG
jgi:DNA ligase D-like protein (predicted 3'-phosphoesterase)